MDLPKPLPPKGPILAYLDGLRASGNKDAINRANEITDKARTCLAGETGEILMQLLEVATTHTIPDPLADPRALAIRAGQSLIASDIRRLMSDETLRILSAPVPGSPGKRRSRAT